MSEDTQLIQLENKISKLFEKKTPKTAIKTRPGAGGLSFPFVDFGYILKELDSNFGIFWEFKITDKSISDKYVWVTGDLTIKSPSGFSISRPGTGGSKIKMSRTTGEPLDIANDIKGATTMAIRKAASLYGIGADVAYKEIGMYETSPDIQDEVENGNKFARQGLVSKYFVVSAQRGFSGEAAKDLIKNGYNVAHMENLTIDQLQKGIEAMEIKYQKVESGEEPLKVGEIRMPKEETPETTVIENEEKIEEDLSI